MSITDKPTLKRKRIIAIVSLVTVIGLMGFISYFAVYKFFSGDNTAEGFERFIEGYGWWGCLVGLGVQFLQVFIALIPGEFVEVGLGLAFGAVEGTVICMAGLAAGSATVFALAKRWGVRLVELFVDPERINSLRFINSEKKLSYTVFILFLIPGTPKDLLTYIVPLTRMKMGEFMAISMLARIPSVVSSTIGGNLFGEGKYLEGAILLIITAIISLAGLKIYGTIIKKYKARRAEKGDNVYESDS